MLIEAFAARPPVCASARLSCCRLLRRRRIAIGWQWRGSAYLWLSSIESVTRFPSGATGRPLRLTRAKSSNDSSSVSWVFSRATAGRWGVWSDVIYLDVGDTKTSTRNFTLNGGTLPASATGNLSLDMKSWLWTIAGMSTVARSADYESHALLGARMAYVKQTLDWALSGSIAGTGLPGTAGRSEVSDTNWDAVVGVTGAARLGTERRWVVPYYFDIGTGQSKLTWQALAGLGYAFDWGTVSAAWRYLEYEYKAGYPLESMQLSGPCLERRCGGDRNQLRKAKRSC